MFGSKTCSRTSILRSLCINSQKNNTFTSFSTNGVSSFLCRTIYRSIGITTYFKSFKATDFLRKIQNRICKLQTTETTDPKPHKSSQTLIWSWWILTVLLWCFSMFLCYFLYKFIFLKLFCCFSQNVVFLNPGLI